MHGHPKFFVVKWLEPLVLEFSVTVRVRVRARDREWIFHSFIILSILKSDNHHCLALMAWSNEEPWQKGLISTCVQLRHSSSPHGVGST